MTGKWIIRVHGIYSLHREGLVGIVLPISSPGLGFLKMADDRTSSVRDVCFEVLCQSMNNFFVWLSIDHRLTDTNRYQSTNFIEVRWGEYFIYPRIVE